MKPEEMTMLNRLAIVGQYGMGALTYRPEEHFLLSRRDMI